MRQLVMFAVVAVVNTMEVGQVARWTRTTIAGTAGQTHVETSMQIGESQLPRLQEIQVADHFLESVRTVLDVIDYECATTTGGTRIGPLQFVEMDPTIIMRTTAFFVLRPTDNNKTPLGYHWVPLSLLRHQAQTNTTLLTELSSYYEHDLYIQVNVNRTFGFGNSLCNFASISVAYSATTLLLHEILHGMGIYSLIHPTLPGGYSGFASIFDSSIHDEYTELLLHGQTIPDATSLAGRILSVANVTLYNPEIYRPGSSLSHFEWPYLMSYSIAPGVCQYDLSDSLLSVLREIGWDCPGVAGSHTWFADPVIVSLTTEPTTNTAWSIPYWAVGLVMCMIVALALVCTIPRKEASNHQVDVPLFNYKQ
jgi:hypothetical protein